MMPMDLLQAALKLALAAETLPKRINELLEKSAQLVEDEAKAAIAKRIVKNAEVLMATILSSAPHTVKHLARDECQMMSHEWQPSLSSKARLRRVCCT